MRCDFNPFGLYLDGCANICAVCQNDFVVKNPFWFMCHAARRMKRHFLLVFHRFVVSASFQMRNLRVKSTHQSLADVYVVFGRIKLGAQQRNAESVHE
eukprot:05913_4